MTAVMIVTIPSGNFFKILMKVSTCEIETYSEIAKFLAF